MSAFDYTHSVDLVREDLAEAHRRAWEHVSASSMDSMRICRWRRKEPRLAKPVSFTASSCSESSSEVPEQLS